MRAIDYGYSAITVFRLFVMMIQQHTGSLAVIVSDG